MKVLLLAIDFPPQVGGIQRILYNFAQYTKFNIIVITPYTKGADNFDNKQKFKIIRTHNIGNKKITSFFILIKAIIFILKEKQDVIFCGHIINALAGYLIKKIYNIPYLVYTYGIEIMNNNRLIYFLLKNAESIITLSNFSKSYLIKMGLKEEKIKICPPGIDTNFFNPNVDIQEVIKKYNLENKKIILTVSRLHPAEKYKGIDDIINELPQIIKEIPELKYIIIGDGGDKKRLENLVAELNLVDYVLFTGKVDEKLLVQLYNVADIFIMLSTKEGFGIVYLEAGACGKPAIAINEGGAKEAVKNGITGIIISGEKKRIKESIIKLLKDEELKKLLGKKAREIIVKEYDIKKITNRLEKLIKECVSQ